MILAIDFESLNKDPRRGFPGQIGVCIMDGETRGRDLRAVAGHASEMNGSLFDAIPEPIRESQTDDPFDNCPDADFSNEGYEPTHKPPPSADPDYILIKKHESAFQKRTIEHYQKQGYEVYKVQTTTSFWAAGSMQSVSKDLWGIFDLEAFKGLETVGIQFTSRGNLGSHLTKMCDHRPVGKNDKTTHAEYLRRWLTHGRLVHLIGFWKDGARWQYELREITLAVMDSYEPGKRFKKRQTSSNA